MPAPASAPGGGTRKRPPRPEPPCNRRRPEQSRAGRPPGDPHAMGDEDEDEGCAVELRITEGGPWGGRGARDRVRAAGTRPGRRQAPAGLIRLLCPQPT